MARDFRAKSPDEMIFLIGQAQAFLSYASQCPREEIVARHHLYRIMEKFSIKADDFRSLPRQIQKGITNYLLTEAYFEKYPEGMECWREIYVDFMVDEDESGFINEKFLYPYMVEQLLASKGY